MLFKETKVYPDFKTFVSFVSEEANLGCNPISSCSAVKEAEALNGTQRDQRHKDMREKKTIFVSNQGTEAASLKSKKTSKQQVTCTFCTKTGHQPDVCMKFLEQSTENRLSFVKENKLCFGCLKKGHISSECRRRLVCSTCNKKHPTCLHEERDTRKEEDEPRDPHKSLTSCTSQGVSITTTSMIVPVWLSSSRSNEEVLAYAILDTQSDATFILKEICDDLDVEMQPTKPRLSTITNQESLVDSHRITDLQVRGYSCDIQIPIPVAYTSTSIPANEGHIPTKTTAKKWRHLQAIQDEMPHLLDCNVGLLIGYDCSQALTPREVRAGKNNEPYGIKTDLGWSIVGGSDVRSERTLCHRVAVKELPAVSMRDILRVLESDFKDHKEDKQVSQEDLLFLEKMESGIRKTENLHYEMPLLFKNRPLLPNNRLMALTRLEHLKRKFIKDRKYKEDYIKFRNEILNRGDAEEAPSVPPENQETWYIPHHGVYHPKKQRIRVVFACSARFKGSSLNDQLLSGPDLTNNQLDVLYRFRMYHYAITCDVEKTFHQFLVPKNDRSYLRFLWWPNGDTELQPKEYRMKVHLFGATSSPGCASYALKHLANQERVTYPTAGHFIIHDFYVDDGLTSVESREDAKELIEGAREVCRRGGLRLHKFIANDRSVMESIPKSEQASDINWDLPSEPLSIERVLGVQWFVGVDSFGFSIFLKDQPLTRRGVLSTVASIYDPLGFLAPLVLKAKRILQEVCQKGVSWDSPLPDKLRPRWEQWKADLLKLQNLRIPRCFIPKTMGKRRSYELHHFADASTFGYGNCSYLRVKDEDNQVNVALVIGKSRVAPTKITTIPRLELTAALVSAKVGTKIREELCYPNLREFFWTDSKVVLEYIKNEAKRFHTFVANRVQEINTRTNIKQWRYIDTKNNPADHASRGRTAEELVKSNWFSGPSFLWEKEIPSNKEETPVLQIGDPEVKATTILTTVKKQDEFSLVNCISKFSDWQKAVAVVTYLRRLIQRNKPTSIHRTLAETQEAEFTIFKAVQRCTFKEEITNLSAKGGNHKRTKNSPLIRLDPFLDKYGILRVGGRLQQSSFPFEQRHPVILPKAHHVTALIIDHFHKKVQHQGRGITMNEIRSNGIWVLSLSSAVSSLIHKCVKCRRQRRPLEDQKMANLPMDRVEPSPPFTYRGMDCFGPFVIKEGRREMKKYAVIFTCMNSRAVHIKVLDDMTTDAFLNVLRCFIAIRGPVHQLRSDQGSNFAGARNELAAAIKEMNVNKITSHLRDHDCEFLLNPSYSSHRGGVWERQIKTIRSILDHLLKDLAGRLDTSSFRTFLYEAMAIINSRPLSTQCLSDPLSPIPLTPNHLLTMKQRVYSPPPACFTPEDIYARKRWGWVQYVVEQFWSRWRKEYLANLNTRQKWPRSKRNLKVGDIVIIQEEAPRAQLALGKIVEASKDKQGLVRTVEILMGTKNQTERPSIIERAVQKVVLLFEAKKKGELSNVKLLMII